MEVTFVKGLGSGDLEPIPKFLISEDANGDEYVIHNYLPRVIVRISDYSEDVQTSAKGEIEDISLDFKTEAYIDIGGKYKKVTDSTMTKEVKEVIEQATDYFKNMIDHSMY